MVELRVKHTLLSASALSFVACSWSFQAMAQEQVAAQQGGVADIIVTAQRRSERLSQVPISVQAASGDMLIAAGITDAAAIERVSAAVSFNGGYSSEATTLAIRGVRSLGFEGGLQPSVAVVIDSMPIARQAEFIADLADIDRIEVLAGPQGTLFGKNSTAGVINILTKNPSYDYGVTGLLEVTDDEEFVGKASLNVPLSSSVAARVNGYYRYLDPLVQNRGLGGDALGQRSYGIQGKMLFDASDSMKIVMTANYNKSFNSFSPNFILIPNSGPLGDFQRVVFGDVFGRGNDVINQDLRSSSRSTSYAFIGEINADLTDSLTLTSVSGYRRYKGRADIDIDGGPGGYRQGLGYSPNPLGYPLEYVEQRNGSPIYDYKYYSQELRINYDASPLNIVGGLFYQNYDEVRINFLPVAIQRSFISLNDIQSSISDDTYAVFADATFNVTDTVKVFAGARYTHENVSLFFSNKTYFAPLDTFDPATGAITATPLLDVAFTNADKYNNLSGRVGVQWQPTPNMNFYASYNRGYKGPAVNQGRDVVTPAQTLLKPEIAQAFEIGAKPRFMGGRLGFDIALYYQKIENVQQSSIIPGTILTTLLNAGDLKTKGFQVDAFFEPATGLTLRTAVVYNDAYYSGSDSSGNPISYACGPSATPAVGSCRPDGTLSLIGRQAVGTPRWKVVSSVDYRSDISSGLRLYARVAYDWRSSVQYTLFQDPLTREPKAGFLDASVGLGGTGDSWKVTVFGKNLTNHFYYNNLNTADNFIGVLFGNLSRDYQRYGGLRFEMKF